MSETRHREFVLAMLAAVDAQTRYRLVLMSMTEAEQVLTNAAPGHPHRVAHVDRAQRLADLTRTEGAASTAVNDAAIAHKRCVDEALKT